MLESVFVNPLQGLKPTVDLSHSQEDCLASLPVSLSISAHVLILVDYRWFACEQPHIILQKESRTFQPKLFIIFFFLQLYLEDGGLALLISSCFS